MLLSRTLLLASLAGGASLAYAQPDYGPAIWNPACSGHWYTSGNGHKFHVIHDMEGYYASTISYIKNCSTTVSIHYCVNGKEDASSDASAGEITQMVRESYYAWHVRCWNTYSTGTEHEGFASNPAWFTESMYQSSSGLTRHITSKFGYAKDRNHIVGHNEWKNSHWTAYAGSAFGIDPTCNSHSDPGSYWDWTHYMALVNLQNPPYLFASNTEGWTAAARLSAINWNGTSWPGIIYADQTGDDAYFYSPATSFTGDGQGVVNVSVYPQNGTSANHNMQVFYRTATDYTFSASKSSPVVNYTASNNWIRLNMDLSGSSYPGDLISQLRLDVDQTNVGTRWIINHVVPQSSLRWYFNSDAMSWTAGHGVPSINWNGTSWPGVLYCDQTNNDAYIYSTTKYFDSAGPYHYLGGANDKVHVRVYPQNGTTNAHDMGIYFLTTDDQTWNEAKSVHTTYTGQNQWVDVYLDVGSNPVWSSADNSSGGITEIRLDFDQVNHSNRWIIDSVTFESN